MPEGSTVSDVRVAPLDGAPGHGCITMFTATDGGSRIAAVGASSRVHRVSAAPTSTDTERTITDGDRAEARSAPFPP